MVKIETEKAANLQKIKKLEKVKKLNRKDIQNYKDGTIIDNFMEAGSCAYYNHNIISI